MNSINIKEKYDIRNILEAECTLTPLICRYCMSENVVFHQYIGDGYCEECGKWQLTGEE